MNHIIKFLALFVYHHNNAFSPLKWTLYENEGKETDFSPGVNSKFINFCCVLYQATESFPQEYTDISFPIKLKVIVQKNSNLNAVNILGTDWSM